MGTFSGWWSKKDLVESIKKDFTENYSAIKHRLVGNHLWTLVEEKETGKRFIALALISCYDKEWGYKPMDESFHPYYYTCPLSLIKEATDPVNEHAKKWREQVKIYHARKQEVKNRVYKTGQVWKYNNVNYILLESAGKRKGWVCKSLTGAIFRINFRQLADATLVENKEEGEAN